MKTIWWDDGRVVLINQQKLPNQLEYIECTSYERVAQAIKTLEIRGAPAIGVAAAMGLALAVHKTPVKTRNELFQGLHKAAEIIRSTRPTARNLFWAVERVLATAQSSPGSVDEVVASVVQEARNMALEDIAANHAMGTFGASVIEDGDVIGTICNAGWLATAGEYGTALGVIKVAHEQGKQISVIALETRPVLQGARLTAFELQQDDIDVKVICDGAIGYCFYQGLIDKFICGADRILVTDGCYVINKVGTHTVSLAAKHYDVPFYVAAPLSTFDFQHQLQEITIEQRDPNEIREINQRNIVPRNVPVFNPAFDITPPELVTALITEKGILHHPFNKNLQKMLA